MAKCPIYRVQLVRETRSLQYVDNDNKAIGILSAYLENEPRENFVILMMNHKNEVLGVHTVHIGTISCSIVGAREVFQAAILANASSVILAHNHPSGDPEPSSEDFKVTKELVDLGKRLDILVRDHIIVGENCHYSMARNNAEIFSELF